MNNTLIPLHPHTNLFGIEVPEDATDFKLVYEDITWYLEYKTPIDKYNCKTVDYDMQLLGTVKNKVIDFDCFEHVGSVTVMVYNIYDDYTYNTAGFNNAQESFLSLIESNNLDLTKDYVILKQI